MRAGQAVRQLEPIDQPAVARQRIGAAAARVGAQDQQSELVGEYFVIGEAAAGVGDARLAVGFAERAAPTPPALARGGNGLVEMGTFVAILIGTIAGGLVVAIEGVGPLAAGIVAVGVAVAVPLTSTVSGDSIPEAQAHLALYRELV